MATSKTPGTISATVGFNGTDLPSQEVSVDVENVNISMRTVMQLLTTAAYDQLSQGINLSNISITESPVAPAVVESASKRGRKAEEEAA